MQKYKNIGDEIECGTFPNSRRYFLVNRCNHCDDAPCVKICPTRALYKREDGIVDFNSSRCIGCKSCMQACPYDALYIDPNSHTAAKCNYCAHRTELGLKPACVVVCPEHETFLARASRIGSTIVPLLGQTPVLLLTALGIDGVVWLGRRKRWTLRVQKI